MTRTLTYPQELPLTVLHPKAKLKEIISRLDARTLGMETGDGGTHPLEADDDEDYEGKGAAAKGAKHPTNVPSTSFSGRISRCTVLLSATLHQDLGALATAIQKNPVPVGFSVQKARLTCPAVNRATIGWHE